jgi:pimeloyl-ACP methyl ester carboxylesterase
MVIGHSMGGFVGQRMAVMAPQRVNRLVLAATAARARNCKTEELARVVEKMRDPVDAGFVREFQQSTIYRKVPAPFLDAVVEASLKVPAMVWKSMLRGLLRTDGDTDLSAIQCPTIIMWGDEDTVFPRSEQLALANGIPNAVLKIMPGVGHAIHWEVPGEFATEVTLFAQRRSAMAPASGELTRAFG